ncbi:hypothetical protein AM587_10001746 [Phytophthora nicotianae]|uniref:Uncharacterized protein n=1 Tax=Phytophthora nicotianae TaxID=4792 RepID=A0A0W8C732_PHYNI|nr:hypothetical protein AM587_10001746 [Phytophthora nicotianae]
MAALRSKRLFGDVVDDDVNICEDVVRDEGEDDGVNEEAMDVLAALMEFESDVDSDVEFEDKSDAFQQDDDAMRRLEWRVYDQAHSVVRSVSRGRRERTWSRLRECFFFFFLPKQLWVHIANETNEFGIQHITLVANAQ